MHVIAYTKDKLPLVQVCGFQKSSTKEYLIQRVFVRMNSRGVWCCAAWLVIEWSERDSIVAVRFSISAHAC